MGQAGRCATRKRPFHLAHPATDLCKGRAALGLGGVLQGQHAEIERHAIKAARVNDPRAAFFGGRVIAVDHIMHPSGFAGQVHIVRPGFHTGLNERFAVELVRPDSGDDAARPSAHVSETVRVIRIGFNQGDIVRQADFITDSR